LSTVDPEISTAAPRRTSAYGGGPPPQAEGANWLVFAGVLVMLVAVLNVIYGIAAIANSSFFVNDARYVLGDLNTWGWITLLIGLVQAFAAYSIWRGGQFGRWLGIGMALLSCIGALLSIPAYPFWSLAVFGVDLLIIYGLAAYGGRHQAV